MKRSVRMKIRAFVVACIVCLTLVTLAGVSRGADWAPMSSGTTQHLTGIWARLRATSSPLASAARSCILTESLGRP